MLTSIFFKNKINQKNFSLKVDGWNGTLGVDLDAIAASMQKQKGRKKFLINFLIS